MKRNLNQMKSLLFAVLICSSILACKKSDSTYYEYENKVQQFNGTTVDYIKTKPGTFDSLLKVLDRVPELKQALTTQELTIFAPVNENFAVALKYLNYQRAIRNPNLPKITLANADAAGLDFMLSKYIFSNRLTTANFIEAVDGVTLSSFKNNVPMQVKALRENASGYVGGGALILQFSDRRGSIFPDRWITTTTDAVNISTSNGTVNILSQLHNFGFDEFTTRLDK
ncbi:hypothetical protein OQZ33_05390 [Pedobacter sp. MC2016-05]|uniref:hypothetical protein n=1 Tax=Pedobacter sp. MC2016-05 TaxID=2994474 RepID=UPI0022471901|nr:hypothetical protein [Pedobacter sp. MC2016-05]MCX2473756.1 hypothetical protein [Pedobacter sp. MC2016-05]